MRHVVFGDVGGHIEPFSEGLKSAGIDVFGRKIPEDTIVVQVGDLVHKGPDSNGVLSMVVEFIERNPGQWVQLAGNHEIQYLIGTRPFISEKLDNEGVALLRNLHAGGHMQPSYAFSGEAGDYLVTHAGLTRPNHIKWAGDEADAFETSRKINEMNWTDLAKPGTMLYGIEDHEAGVFWAEAAGEVYASWNASGVVPPFHQIHGHSTLRVWKRYGGLLRDSYREWITMSMTNDFDRMHTAWQHKGKSFHGIDNKFEKVAHSETLWPLIVESSD